MYLKQPSPKLDPPPGIVRRAGYRLSGSLIYMSTMPMCMYKCANDDISPSRRLAIRTKLQGKKDNLNRLSRRRKNFHKSANKNLKSSESSSSGLMAGTSASKLSVTAAPVPRTASRPKSFCSLDSLSGKGYRGILRFCS